jgi:phosphatidylglycerol:prolipoprotein diacylglycerol transferase
MIRTRPYTPGVVLAESIVHTCDKFALRLSGDFGVRWYGLAYAAGFVVAWLVMRWFARTRRSPITVAQAGDIATILAFGLLIGGRLGHIIFYEPDLLVSFTNAFPFWGVLQLQRGGMSSHGGIIGIAVATFWLSHRSRVPALVIGDLACFVAPIGLGLGRMANWVNGELWGKPLPDAAQESPPWWSVKYPEEMLLTNFPNADRLAELAPLRTQLGIETQVPIAEALYRACYADNAAVIAKVAPLLTARYPINFMQAMTDGVVLFTILAVAWVRPRPAGWIFGWFMLTYGILRIITEQYRTPDPDILTIGPVTLPMTLSALMCAIGAATLTVVGNRSDRHGGLLRDPA